MNIKRVDGGKVSELTKGSHKKIIFSCDVCQKEVKQSYQNYLKQNDGKFCRTCRNKHTANRKDVKEKQSKATKKKWESKDYRSKMSELISKATKNRWDKDDGTRRKQIWNKTPYKETKKLIKSVKGYKLITPQEEYEEVGNIFKVKCPDGSIMETTVAFWNSRMIGKPLYDTYAPQLEWCNEVRRYKKDKNILQVKCKMCGEWYIPSIDSVGRRIQAVKRNNKGESNLYCSDTCKNSCSIYGKKPITLIKENEIRHMQAQWREMVLEKDEYKCQKCGSKKNLIAHHIKPVKLFPLESCDVDNGIILCRKCHNKAHHIPGCSTGELAKLKRPC